MAARMRRPARQARAVVRELSSKRGAHERRDAETARQRIAQPTARGGPTAQLLASTSTLAAVTRAGAASKGRRRASAVRVQTPTAGGRAGGGQFFYIAADMVIKGLADHKRDNGSARV